MKFTFKVFKWIGDNPHNLEELLSIVTEVKHFSWADKTLVLPVDEENDICVDRYEGDTLISKNQFIDVKVLQPEYLPPIPDKARRQLGYYLQYESSMPDFVVLKFTRAFQRLLHKRKVVFTISEE